MSSSFEDMAAYVPFAWNFLGEGEPQRIQGAAVGTPEFFKVLGVKPLVGRVFTEADTRLNGPCTVILGYSFWENAFGRRADILGKTIRLDNDLCTVIGVMPPGFMFPTRDGTL